jgi:tRNA1(Val) A37 N6-methylase TrmN6
MSQELCDIGEDRLLGGGIRLRQPRKGHRAGTDAVLLAMSVGDVGAARIVDLGAGVGAVGLIIAAQCPAATVTLVEREPALVGLARDNIHLNRFDARMAAVHADILAPASQRRAAGLLPGSFDLAVSNPPWLEAGASRPSPEPRRAKAHVLAPGSIEAWLKTAADLLAPHGALTMIHRADALPGLLAASANRFGAIALRFIHPQAGEAAIRVLLRGVKGSRAPLRVLPPLVLHRADGRFTQEAEALQRGVGKALG